MLTPFWRLNKKEKTNGASVTYDDQTADASEKPSEQSNVRDEKNEGGEVAQKTDEAASDKQQDNTQAVEEYSEGVKKRIAKLTKKMREAERQKEEALRYAQSIKKERDRFQTEATSLDKNYAAEMEGRISSSLAMPVITASPVGSSFTGATATMTVRLMTPLSSGVARSLSNPLSTTVTVIVAVPF